MHAVNPHCCYCGVVTILRERKNYDQKPTDCTLEHIKSRLNGGREGRNRRENLTIACYACNIKKGIEDVANCPKEEWDRLSIRGRALDSWFAAWNREMDRFDRF